MVLEDILMGMKIILMMVIPFRLAKIQLLSSIKIVLITLETR
jgi:hypothetical protein